jgi:hypothetical protein
MLVGLWSSRFDSILFRLDLARNFHFRFTVYLCVAGFQGVHVSMDATTMCFYPLQTYHPLEECNVRFYSRHIICSKVIPNLDGVDDMVNLSKLFPKKDTLCLQNPKFKLEPMPLTLMCSIGDPATRKSISTSAPTIGGGSCA